MDTVELKPYRVASESSAASAAAARRAAATRRILEAPILPTIARLAAPNVVLVLVQTAVSVVETWLVGRLGTTSLAALALVFPFVILMQMMSAGSMGGGVASAVARALGAVLERGPASFVPLRESLLSGLGDEIKALRLALDAQRVTLQDLPRDLTESWVAADGRARVEVFPAGDPRDSDSIRRFVESVQTVAPEATGGAVANFEAGQVVVRAFVTAGALALGTITLVLAIALRRARDVLLVLAPLVLAGALTLATCTLIGLPINFANIIALPLLLGIGVAFSVYFVMNWRAGVQGQLQSPTARALVFSALTTGSAFGSLALSSHPGTASMGMLLAMGLAYEVGCTLLVLPALLGVIRRG